MTINITSQAKLVELGTGTGDFGSTSSFERSLCFGKWAIPKVRKMKPKTQTSDSLLIGSLFHYLWDKYMLKEIVLQQLVAWHQNMETSFLFEFISNGNKLTLADDCLEEALRIMIAYIKNNGSTSEFGVISDIEKEVSLRYKGTEYTTRIDALATISKLQAQTLNQRYGLSISEGIYIIDNKTSSRRESKSEIEDEFNPQFKWLPTLFQATTHITPLGVLVNHISKTKNPERWVNFVPFLPEDPGIVEAILVNDLNAIDSIKDNWLPVNPVACNGKWSTCWLATHNHCNRTGYEINDQQKQTILEAFDNDQAQQ